MRKIRVLIVDDAVAVRRMVADVLSADPALEVAGTAPTGRIALAKILQTSPDLVTLDVEMPEMDGLQTLAAIREVHPQLPVIMFSTLTRRGAEATLDALLMGARDYVTKPAAPGGVEAAQRCIRDQLIARIKALCAVGNDAGPAAGAAGPVRPDPRASRDPRKASVLAIGVSTGGPNALADLLPCLPKDLPVPVLVVQHMPAAFTELLAARLARRCALPVSEGVTGRTLRPGQILVAPGDYHMVVERHGASIRLRTHQGPPENSCRPAVDVLFRSVAEVYGDGALGVVMTGMGQDGFRGCQMIRDAGGQVLAQDEATSVVWGMAGFVVRAGLADLVLPLQRLAPEILRRILGGVNERTVSREGAAEAPLAAGTTCR